MSRRSAEIAGRSPLTLPAVRSFSISTSHPSGIRPRITVSPARIWPGIWLLAATHLAAFADRLLIALLAPAVKVDLGLSDFQIGLLQGTAFVAVFVVASALCGPVVDRIHRPRLICASILVWSLGSIGCGLATSMGEMAGARMLLGLGQACLTPVALSLIAARQTRARLGRGVSIYTAGATLGRSSALLLGGGLMAILPATTHLAPVFEPMASWRAVFLLSCLPNIVLALLYLAMPDPERARGHSGGRLGREPGGRLAPWVFRHAGRYAAHTLAAAALILIVQSVNAWTVVLYVRRFGLTLAEAGSTFGLVVALAAPAGHLAGGWIFDWLARHRRRQAAALILASCLGAIPGLMAVFGLSRHFGLSLGGLVTLIFILGISAPAGLVGLQAMTPRRLRGRATALFIALGTAAGFGIGPPLIGLLSDRVFGAGGIGEACVAVVVPVALLGCAAALAGARMGAKPRRAYAGHLSGT